MKTTVDIPDTELEDVMRFTGATSALDWLADIFGNEVI